MCGCLHRYRRCRRCRARVFLEYFLESAFDLGGDVTEGVRCGDDAVTGAAEGGCGRAGEDAGGGAHAELAGDDAADARGVEAVCGAGGVVPGAATGGGDTGDLPAVATHRRRDGATRPGFSREI